ncbi:MAG: cytochrome c3 family protein [Thermoanaerobaculia bacterium]|nr:cytochrome c3 family protein [Thermoanaerobaculia bacterium]
MQIFHRSTNLIARLSIYGGVFLIAGTLGLALLLTRSSYNTGKGIVIAQPIPFSHDHHTAGLGISCLYCHTSVEEAAYAGIPATSTCMNCHKLIWNDSPMLEPVRASYREGRPMEWIRVHDLPDYVYFNHSIHVAKGFGCSTCHGRIDQMKLVYKAETMQMEWCLTCHREPERFVRPVSEIYNMAWKAEDQAALGARLSEEYALRSLITCSTCHR